MIEETENDKSILLVDVKKEEETSFQRKLREFRKNKEQHRRELLEFVNDPEVQAYYRDPKNILY